MESLARGADARPLLRFGLVVGPFYLIVALAQALVREGFDLTRHPLSVLANGPGGWIQVANFLITGAMVLAAAAGIRRALAPKGLATTVFLAVYGLCVLISGVFKGDPVDGFPVGTPEGFPTTFSTAGMTHFIAGAIGFLCLGISALCAWRAMARRGDASTSRRSLIAGVVVLLGFFGGPMMPSPELMILGIWIAVVAGWVWLAMLSSRLGRL